MQIDDTAHEAARASVIDVIRSLPYYEHIADGVYRALKAASPLDAAIIDMAWARLRLRTNCRVPSEKDTPVTVMVHSFDGYKRFWAPARFFTERAIPAGIPIYYVTEQSQMHPDDSKSIRTGKGGFSTRLANALDEISSRHKYVLYLQEDIWLEDPISPPMLSHFVQLMDAHDLDCLKLGWASFMPEDYVSIVQTTDLLPNSVQYRWFGPHRYSMSHHCSIFRSNFFWCTARLARLLGQERPVKNELFVSNVLKKRIKSRNGDRKEVRIAVWNEKPTLAYTHACFEGRLTDDGQRLLDLYNINHLYNENLPGEVFPKPKRLGLRQIPR